MNQRALLLGRDHVEEGAVHAVGGAGWGAAISKGLASPAPKADPNEDACCAAVAGDLTLAAVADAHWGGASAWITARVVADGIGRLVGGRVSGLRLADLLRESSESIAAARSRSECAALIAAVRGDRAWWATIGDCRCYLVPARGPVTVLNPLQNAYLGADPTWLPLDAGVYSLSPGDRLVLATDGIPECTYGRETFLPDAVGAIARIGSPSLAAEALIREALDRGGQDNVAVVVLAPG